MENEVTIQQILKQAVSHQVSDTHIKSGAPPIFRINRKLREIPDFGVITDEDTRRFLASITSEDQQNIFYHE